MEASTIATEKQKQLPNAVVLYFRRVELKLITTALSKPWLSPEWQ